MAISTANLLLPVQMLAETELTGLPLPPSIMFHSRHRWILPYMMEWLVAEGWQGINYLTLEKALLGETTLPEKPIILSVDDISMAAGNPAYESFVAMKASITDAGFEAVFSVITRNAQPQDEARWTEVISWQDEGIELATHTMSHINLNNIELIDVDFQREIVRSAKTISDYTGQPVRTLVTPYGSGYERYSATIHPQVKAACETAGIRFIVGIVDGRADLPLNPPPEQIFYVGRSGPGFDDTLPGLISTLENWHTHRHTKRPAT